MNLADIIDRNAAFAPDKPALRFEGRALTYAAFAARIDRAASVLAGELSVRRGDRVAILATNHPDTLVLLYACARLGALLVPLNWRLAAPEIAYILANAEPAVLIVSDEFAALAPDASVMRRVALDGDAEGLPSLATLITAGAIGPVPAGGRLQDPVLVVYTSGTTGRPKGAVLTQEALTWNAVMSQHMHGMTADDHVLTVLPFFHVGGLNIQTTPALQAGATVTIHARFAPGLLLSAIVADRPSLTVLVPTTMAAAIADPAFAASDLSSLRALTTGSTYVPQPLIDAFEGRGVLVLQVYGATETCPVAIYTRLGGRRAPEGSTGWPGLACEGRVVDEASGEVPNGQSGEIWIRGPQVLVGYWRDEPATAEALSDGWFRTGDIATRSPDGAFTVHDRKRNVIISGGENIYAAEIERALLSHPAVAEAAVVGRPDPRWGETPVAFVVLRTGHACGADMLRAHLSGELARFKLPGDLWFVPDLPRNALGKVQHFELRRQFAAGSGAAS